MTTFHLLPEKKVHAFIEWVNPEEDHDRLSIDVRELLAEGEARGISKGECNVLLRRFQKKFGHPPAWVKARLDEADHASLEI